jgi:hypothetical protein
MHVSIYTAREDVYHGATPGDPHLPSDRPGEEWVDVSTWPGVCQAKTPDWYRIMPRERISRALLRDFPSFHISKLTTHSRAGPSALTQWNGYVVDKMESSAYSKSVCYEAIFAMIEVTLAIMSSTWQ